MHQESPPGNYSNHPLFLMGIFCQPCVICSLIFLRKGTGFVAPEFVDSDFHRHGIPPPPGTTFSMTDAVEKLLCNRIRPEADFSSPLFSGTLFDSTEEILDDYPEALDWAPFCCISGAAKGGASVHPRHLAY